MLVRVLQGNMQQEQRSNARSNGIVKWMQWTQHAGGFFDNSTSSEDRRKYLLSIMQPPAQENAAQASCTLSSDQVCTI